MYLCKPYFARAPGHEQTRYMAVWRLIIHYEDPERLLQWSLQNNRIALGWS